MARIKSKVSRRFKVRLDLNEEEMTWLLLVSSKDFSIPDLIRKTNGWGLSNPIPAQVGILLHTIHQECMNALGPNDRMTFSCPKESDRPSEKPKASTSPKK